MADRHRYSYSSSRREAPPRPSRPSKTAADVHDRDSDSSSSGSEQSDNSNSLNAFANDGSFLARFKQMQEACQQQAQAQADDAQFVAPTSTAITVKTEKEAAADDASSAAKKRALPFVGKRRGGKVLKTGVVHKPKVNDESAVDATSHPSQSSVEKVSRALELRVSLRSTRRSRDTLRALDWLGWLVASAVLGLKEELPKDAWSRYLAEVRKYRERSCDDEEKTRPLVK